MKIISTLFTTLLIALLVGVAGLLIGSMLPIPGNIELKIVKSGSMEPLIPTGSLVVVKPATRYSINDIVTFGADTKTEIPTTHRIIGFEGVEGETRYRTKGDANEDSDTNTIARGDIIGKVILHAPYVGFVLDFARQPLGFALLIGVPAVLVILEEVLAIAREVKAALRRREKGKDRDLQGGGGNGNERVSSTRLVYLRKRAMDEIFVPMVMETRKLLKQPRPHSDAYGTATFVVMGMVFISSLLSGGAGGTISYFNDIERSIGNLFQAGSGDDFLDGREVLIQQLVVEEEPELLKIASEPEEGEGEVLGATDEAEVTEEEPEGGGGGSAASEDEPAQMPANEPVIEPVEGSEPLTQDPVEEAPVKEETPAELEPTHEPISDPPTDTPITD